MILALFHSYVIYPNKLYWFYFYASFPVFFPYHRYTALIMTVQEARKVRIVRFFIIPQNILIRFLFCGLWMLSRLSPIPFMSLCRLFLCEEPRKKAHGMPFKTLSPSAYLGGFLWLSLSLFPYTWLRFLPCWMFVFVRDSGTSIGRSSLRIWILLWL